MNTSVTTETCRSSGTGEPFRQNQNAGLITAAIEVLVRGEELLETLSESDYTRSFQLAYGASVGEHFRHCLDHFSSLLNGTESKWINYDNRDRDSKIENDPEAALATIVRLKKQLSEIDSDNLDGSVSVRCKVNYSDHGSPEYDSTIAREFAYVIAHTIHHYALISILCGMMGVKLNPSFGVAPSTIAHQSGN